MKKKNRGFTYIEVVIAMLLLAVVAGGMIRIFAFGREQADKQGRMITAFNFSRQLTEAFLSRPWDDTVLADTGTATTFVDLTSYGSLPQLPGGVPFTDPLQFNASSSFCIDEVDYDSVTGPSAVDYKKITVRVHWDEVNE